MFFDEIQECPNARTAIKFLVEDNRFDYIESGSLLGINYKDFTSYPVGFEEEIRLYPLDFEEFLWAKGIGENVVEVLRKCYKQEKAVPDFIHKQMIKFEQFNHSLCIVDTKDVPVNLTKEYRAIIEEMRSVAKYFGK